METTPDLQWLRDCGFVGWMVERTTGKVYTLHGDEFASAAELRSWLMGQSWPESVDGQREVPAKSK